MRSGVPTSCGDGSRRARGQVVDLVVALVPDARRVHPPQHVAAAIRARQPHVLADGERHRPAGAVDLVGELHAGRRRADDEHAAVGQLPGIAVVERREACDRRAAPPARSAGTTGGCRRRSRARRVRQSKLARGRWRRGSRRRSARDRRDRRVRAHRRGGRRARSREMKSTTSAHRHEAVGIGALVAIAGQPALPVRRQQPQRVPALAPPGVGDLAALEHHVIDRALGEAAARRQPGVAGADDDRGDAFDARRP